MSTQKAEPHLRYQTSFTKTGKVNMKNMKPYRTERQKALIKDHVEVVNGTHKVVGAKLHLSFHKWVQKMKKDKNDRTPKALNIVRKTEDNRGFQVYQHYGDLKIPLLGIYTRGKFVEKPAASVEEAHQRLNLEYYE